MAYNPDELLDMYPRYMHLQICVDGNPELFNRYASEIQTRNNKIFNIIVDVFVYNILIIRYDNIIISIF